MQGFGLQNAALGIRNSSNKWNPSSADKDLYLESGIHGLESGIQEVDCLVFPYVGRKGSKRITRCILDMFLPESSLSASSVSTAVSVASSESSSVKSVLSLSISSFDSTSLSSSKEKKIEVYLGRNPYTPPRFYEPCSSHWYWRRKLGQVIFGKDIWDRYFWDAPVSYWIIAHLRYFKILTLNGGLRFKIANFSRLYCLAIPRRDLNTKKTKPKVEK